MAECNSNENISQAQGLLSPGSPFNNRQDGEETPFVLNVSGEIIAQP